MNNKELWGCKYGDEWSCPCDECMLEPLSESCEKFRKDDGNELVYIDNRRTSE